MTDQTTQKSVKALADVSCRMCFGTGKTARYRGPDREGPCIFCHGTGFICTPARAHLGASHD